MPLVALTREVAVVYFSVLGLFIGSFLNVCIYRLPIEGQSVSRPRRSHCPKCGHAIRWFENIPVLSWVFLLRGKCAGCKAPIPWRYPLVELLTGVLYLAVILATPEGEWLLLLTRLLVISGLVVATFVDFDCFEIPDEVSIGGMVAAPLLALLVPSIHADTWLALKLSEGALEVTRIGSLTGCLAGMLVGGGLLWSVGWAGSRVFGREAMGFGDVKLLAAGGGFVGPGGILVALMLASLVASVAGIGNILRFLILVRHRDRVRKRNRSFKRALVVARIAGRYVPFGPYLAVGIGIVLLYWNDVKAWILAGSGV